MQLIALSVLVIAGASAWAFRLDLAGTWKFWVALGVPYGALALLALGRLRQDGRLRDVLRPRWGDLSLGVVTGAILLLGSLAARSTLAPTNTARHLWFLRLYAQVGDAETVQRSLVYTSVLLLIIVAEELVWRGMVLDAAQTRFDPGAVGWLPRWRMASRTCRRCSRSRIPSPTKIHCWCWPRWAAAWSGRSPPR